MRYALLCLIPVLAYAADGQTSTSTTTAPAAVPDAIDLTGLDRTRPLTAVGGGVATTLISDGDEISNGVLRGSYAPQRNIGFTAELPVLVHRHWDNGHTETGAFGDLTVGATIATEIQPRLRVGAGLDLTLDTASKDAIGNNATLITPVAVGAFELDDLTRVIGSVRYTQDLDHATDVPDVSELEVRGGIIRMLTTEAFGVVEGRQRTDFEDSRLKLAVYGAAGLEIEKHHVVRGGLLMPLDRYTREATGWVLTLDYAYVF
jgi:hypothetical protein